jgi:hypothetical protein
MLLSGRNPAGLDWRSGPKHRRAWMRMLCMLPGRVSIPVAADVGNACRRAEEGA